MTTVLDNIGLLVTNDSASWGGLLGIVRDASVVFEGDRIVSVGASGQVADQRIDAGGRCVVPGFVDSHSHLVFAGDRSDEFAARMAGAPYQAGGINVSVDATRSASASELERLTAGRRAEALRAGITTIEIKSGYGLDVETERRSIEVASSLTNELTFLGAHVVPREYAGRPDAYIDLVCNDMLTAAVSAGARWIDAFCEVGAFDADQCREVLTTGAARGLGQRLHANQLGEGPGAQLAVEMGCASADHCTHLTDRDIEALSAGRTVATLLPATDFSTRQPYPNARRLIDAGATVALATNCNPGSSFTTSMSFCMALAVRDMHMTAEEALWSATAGGARALQRTDVGTVAAGAKADFVVLDAPSYTHLVYRPGVPLIGTVIEAGVVRWALV